MDIEKFEKLTQKQKDELAKILGLLFAKAIEFKVEEAKRELKAALSF